MYHKENIHKQIRTWTTTATTTTATASTCNNSNNNPQRQLRQSKDRSTPLTYTHAHMHKIPTNQTHIFTFIRWPLYKIICGSFSYDLSWPVSGRSLGKKTCIIALRRSTFLKEKPNPPRYQLQFSIWADWFVVSVILS